MKLKLLLLNLIILSLTINAQNIYFHSELGPCFTGTGDLTGLTTSEGIGKNFNEHLSASINFEMQTFNITPINLNLIYKNIGITGYYTVYISNIGIDFGIGGFYRFPTYTLLSLQQSSNTLNANITTTANPPTVGYYLSVGLSLPINDYLFLTGRTTLQNDLNGNITETIKTGLIIYLQ